MARTIRFEAGQYAAEIERAIQDKSWESPARKAGRLIRESVDRALLAARGFHFTWAGPGTVDVTPMTVSLELEPGPYQVLVHLPWDGQDFNEIASRFRETLSRAPESWPHVEWFALEGELPPPPMVAGWRPFTRT